MVSLTNFRSFDELALASESGHQIVECHSGMLDGQTGNRDGQFELESNPKKYHLHQQANFLNEKPPKIDLSISKSDHFEIRWRNLTYQVEPKWYQKKLRTFAAESSSSDFVSNKSEKTNILCSLNGTVKSGQVTAILGPSGAGKTSLLGCLTGKHKSGVSGSVQVISNRVEPMSICTIPQKGESTNWKVLL
mgnify:CR=1 FL=1